MSRRDYGPHCGADQGDGTCACITCWCHDPEPFDDPPEPGFELQLARPPEDPKPLRYMAGMVDRKVKGGYRGTVELIRGGKIEKVAVVFGKTLEEMRHRKNLIVATFRCQANHVKF